MQSASHAYQTTTDGETEMPRERCWRKLLLLMSVPANSSAQHARTAMSLTAVARARFMRELLLSGGFFHFFLAKCFRKTEMKAEEEVCVRH